MSDQLCDCCDESQICRNTSACYAEVNLPVKLKPYAKVCAIETQCCGEPVVTLRQGGQNCSCEISITQMICIKIPVEYGTVADAGDTTVNCNRNSNCCNGCYR